MLICIIRNVIRFRTTVLMLVAAAALLSIYSIRTAPLDAIPDISDPQLVIYVKWARSPELLENEVTEPLIRALIGSPDIKAIRATSHLGYSFIYVILHDAGQREKVKQLALDRINAIRPQLPPDAVVTLGPNASSMGWIYEYALVDRTETRDLRELRLLNEGRVKLALQSVPGVAEELSKSQTVTISSVVWSTVTISTSLNLSLWVKQQTDDRSTLIRATLKNFSTAIAIGEMADATIVIVENCTAELAKRGRLSHAEKIETIIRATARMTRPLLFSLLIILASFLPVFFLGDREGRWCFTLPGLHVFLQRQDDVFSHIDYKQFRKLLFSSPVNRAVKEFGAGVTIIGNRAKVDKSRYALVWQTTSLARDHE